MRPARIRGNAGIEPDGRTVRIFTPVVIPEPGIIPIAGIVAAIIAEPVPPGPAGSTLILDGLIGPDPCRFRIYGAALAAEAGLHLAAVHPGGNAAERQSIGISAGDIETGYDGGSLSRCCDKTVVGIGDVPGDGDCIGGVGDEHARTAIGDRFARRVFRDPHLAGCACQGSRAVERTRGSGRGKRGGD